METLDGTILPFKRFGWYFRPSTYMYEFWSWLAETPTMLISAEVVPAMPSWMADEIYCAVSLKGDRGVLDD